MRPRNVGSELKVATGNVPVAASAGTRNGAAIDRQGFLSCVLVAVSGAVSGSPSAQTLDAKLQDSADGSTGWADYVPAGAGSGAITQITAANTLARKNIDLSKAKRHIRVVEVVGFTGGTSPTLGAQEVVVLGGADVLPA